MLAGNVSVLMERNEMIDSREAAVQLMGAGAVVRGNRISGGAAMGIVAENARARDHRQQRDRSASPPTASWSRARPNTLVRGNRVHNCGYGMAFVLGDARSPSTRGGQHDHRAEVQRHRRDRRFADPAPQSGAAAARAGAARRGFRAGPAARRSVRKPFLDNNNFGAGAATIAAAKRRTGQRALGARR